MRMSALPALALTCLVLGGAAPSAPVAAATDPGGITVYVNPADSVRKDARAQDGRAPERPAASFAAVQRLLAGMGATEARVLIHGGTYHPREEVNWTYSPPGGHITFAPEPGTGPVVFDGSRLKPSRLSTAARQRLVNDPAAVAAAPGYFMTITSAGSGITISGETIQNYVNGGIRIRGAAGDRVTDVTVSGNTFQHLGNKYVSGGTGYGGVHITNSSHTVIENNRFYNLENTTSPGNIHGVYLADYTNDSTIRGNRFGYVSGDPVRTRHNSKDNLVDGNKFWHTGTYAIFSDWRFDGEDCGRGNVFKNNQVGTVSYYGKKFSSGTQGQVSPIKVWLWGHDDPKNANLGGCTPDPITSGGGNAYVTTRPW